MRASGSARYGAARITVASTSNGCPAAILAARVLRAKSACGRAVVSILCSAVVARTSCPATSGDVFVFVCSAISAMGSSVVVKSIVGAVLAKCSSCPDVRLESHSTPGRTTSVLIPAAFTAAAYTAALRDSVAASVACCCCAVDATFSASTAYDCCSAASVAAATDVLRCSTWDVYVAACIAASCACAGANGSAAIASAACCCTSASSACCVAACAARSASSEARASSAVIAAVLMAVATVSACCLAASTAFKLAVSVAIAASTAALCACTAFFSPRACSPPTATPGPVDNSAP